MSKPRSSWLALALCAGLFASAGAVRAEDDESIGFERTPPRLSFVDGEVSYFRPGAEDWTNAVVNTALAPGDELATGAGANLELQVGGRAFARAGENTQLALTSLEPDFQQLRVTSGHVSLDLRSLESGQTFEIDTPNAAFTIDRAGYYRVAVEGDSTTFISRRGGRATLTPAAGESLAIAAGEQVVVTGEGTPQVETYAAPELDAWDRWNYARTDDQQGSVSARYVPSGVYGASDLDRHGDWRVVPTYGSMWVPRGVAAGWAPYSTGRWVYDPYYGWTWVDDYAWGWAPYHYGRWVHYSGYWGWCPGPIVARPYYAPALVGFYGGGFSVNVSFGVPYVGWVALGWGEPLIPWWGPARFRGYPRWAGWGGPRYINNVAYRHNTVYNINEINVYRNARVRNAIVAVDRDHFGRRWRDGSGDGRGGRDGRDGSRFTRVGDDQRDGFRPLRGDPGVRPDRSSLVADGRSARRPSREDRQRSVVATRQPRFDRVQGLDTRRGARDGQGRDGRARAESGAPDGLPAARLVEPSRDVRRNQVSRRESLGSQGDRERRSARPEPRFRQRETAAQASPPAARNDARERGPRAERSRTAAPSARASQGGAPTRDQAERARRAALDRAERQRAARPERSFASPQPPAQRTERARPERGDGSRRREQATAPQRQLQGQPANRAFQSQGQRPERAERASRQQQQIERAGREPRGERAAQAPQMQRPARQSQSQRPAREPQQQARADRSDWQSRPQWSQRESPRAEARPQFQARAQGGGERSGEARSRGNGGGGGGGRRGDAPQAAGDNGGSNWHGGGGGGWNGGGGRGGGGGGRVGGNFGGSGRGSRGR
jgi:hypothetical protein